MAVSVIMPVRDTECFLRESIESTLGQTYKDFELIVVDDGSTDETVTIAEEYAKADDRIRVIRQPPLGIAHALNRCIREASNELLVRMDADDVMLPERIERQVGFMRVHPEIAVASSFVYYLDDRGRIRGRLKSAFTTSEAARRCFEKGELVGFHHPAVIMRKSMVEALSGYRQEFWPIEDLDLWNRALLAGYDVAVQPECLLKYRIHSRSTAISKPRLAQKKMAWLTHCLAQQRRGLPASTLSEFESYQQSRSAWTRINQERRDLAAIFYKTAVAPYMRGNYPRVLVNMAASFVLQPCFLVSKVLSRALHVPSRIP